ncbi:hypothetical protein PLICRDRAFT_228211 [Plicaturopsis crispa FD-325 SS-3]|nr:hypothetical protein PLICRDRAFT_228211 [Plicaturopsis crispa FD-325 SS-3]
MSLRSPEALPSVGSASSGEGNLNALRTTRYMQFAFLTLMIYDHALTFNLEREHIWPLSWRMPKVLFIMNRIDTNLESRMQICRPRVSHDRLVGIFVRFQACIAPSHFTSASLNIFSCEFLVMFEVWPSGIAVAVVEMVTVLRVSALWLPIAIVVVGAIWNFDIHDYNGPLAFPSSPGCLTVQPTYMFAITLAMVVFEVTIIVVTLYKIRQGPVHSKAAGDWPMRMLIARDSLIYFILMFAMLLANAIMYKLSSPYHSILMTPCGVVACVTVPRMMINMREIRQRQRTQAALPNSWTPTRRQESQYITTIENVDA